MAEPDKNESLRNEYLNRLARYEKTDEAMRRKYGQSFEDFEAGEIVAQNDYRWDVESDAVIWKSAFEAIRKLRQKLQALSGNG